MKDVQTWSKKKTILYFGEICDIIQIELKDIFIHKI